MNCRALQQKPLLMSSPCKFGCWLMFWPKLKMAPVSLSMRSIFFLAYYTDSRSDLVYGSYWALKLVMQCLISESLSPTWIFGSFFSILLVETSDWFSSLSRFASNSNYCWMFRVIFIAFLVETRLPGYISPVEKPSGFCSSTSIDNVLIWYAFLGDSRATRGDSTPYLLFFVDLRPESDCLLDWESLPSLGFFFCAACLVFILKVAAL